MGNVLRFFSAFVLAVSLTFGTVGVAAGATGGTTVEAQVRALGCDVGAAPGYGDRVVLLRNGDVQRWSFHKLIRSMLDERFFWMVGNCPVVREA